MEFRFPFPGLEKSWNLNPGFGNFIKVMEIVRGPIAKPHSLVSLLNPARYVRDTAFLSDNLTTFNLQAGLPLARTSVSSKVNLVFFSSSSTLLRTPCHLLSSPFFFSLVGFT